MTLAPERPTTATQAPATTIQNGEARLPITRFFTRPETDPYDQLAWEIRSAVINGSDGKAYSSSTTASSRPALAL